MNIARVPQSFVRPLATCLLLALALLSGARAAQPVDALKLGVVRVVAAKEGGSLKEGSGFIIRLDPAANGRFEQARILTAYHVIDDADRITVQFSTTERRVEAEVRHQAKDLDLAVLVVTGSDIIPPNVRELEVKPKTFVGGESILALGYAAADTAVTVVSGHVAGVPSAELRFSGDRAVDVRAGFSGGPVFSGESVVGLITRVGSSATAVPNTAVAAGVVRSFIEPDLVGGSGLTKQQAEYLSKILAITRAGLPRNLSFKVDDELEVADRKMTKTLANSWSEIRDKKNSSENSGTSWTLDLPGLKSATCRVDYDIHWGSDYVKLTYFLSAYIPTVNRRHGDAIIAGTHQLLEEKGFAIDQDMYGLLRATRGDTRFTMNTQTDPSRNHFFVVREVSVPCKIR